MDQEPRNFGENLLKCNESSNSQNRAQSGENLESIPKMVEDFPKPTPLRDMENISNYSIEWESDLTFPNPKETHIL